MKYKGDPNEITVTQTSLGKVIGVTQQRIGQLIEEEIVVRDESDTNGAVFLVESLRNYYLSKNVSGEGTVNFWKEKGLHEKAKRQLAELKLAERRGELYEAETVESVMVEHLTNFRTKLLGIPSKVAAAMPAELRGEVYDVLTSEIENCLDELSKNYKDADLKTAVEIEVDEENNE